MSNAALEYISQAKAILDRIESTQMGALEEAAEQIGQNYHVLKCGSRLDL